MFTQDDKAFLATLIQTQVPQIVKKELAGVENRLEKLEEGLRVNSESLQILSDHVIWHSRKLDQFLEREKGYKKVLDNHEDGLQNHSFKLMGLDKNQNRLNERVERLEQKVA